MSVATKPALLELISKSYRDYFQLTWKFRPLDHDLINFLISKMKLSVSHGYHMGKDGQCYYRHDKKIRGFYYATTMAKLIHDLPVKASRASIYRSLNRLQAYGYIIKHQTIRTSKNGLQIFMPVLDHAIQKWLNDPNYQTTVNPDYMGLSQNDINDRIKMTLSNISKRYERSYQNDTNDRIKMIRTKNNHINKNRKRNNRLSNNVYMNNAENKFSGVIKNTHKSLGLNIKVLKTISGFSHNHNDYKNIINKLLTVTSYKHNKELKRFRKQGYFINKSLRKFKTSPYFNDNEFIQDLDSIFGQIDYNTKNNDSTPNRKHYGGYIVSTITSLFIHYLLNHHLIHKSKAKRKHKLSNEEKQLLSDKTPKLHPTSKALMKKLGLPIKDQDSSRSEPSNEEPSKDDKPNDNKNTQQSSENGTEEQNKGDDLIGEFNKEIKGSKNNNTNKSKNKNETGGNIANGITDHLNALNNKGFGNYEDMNSPISDKYKDIINEEAEEADKRQAKRGTAPKPIEITE